MTQTSEDPWLTVAIALFIICAVAITALLFTERFKRFTLWRYRTRLWKARDALPDLIAMKAVIQAAEPIHFDTEGKFSNSEVK